MLELTVKLMKLIGNQKYSKAKEVCAEINRILCTYDKSC